MSAARLDPALALPAAPAMEAALRARLPGFDEIAWLAETGSTNTDLMTSLRAQVQSSAPPQLGSMRLLGAHWQRSGRGRAGRTLVNQPGQMLMFSCAFAACIAPPNLPCLSLAAGLAACEVLRDHARPGQARALAIKWPNDVQLGQAKLAGLLVESLRLRAAGEHAYGIVIGMGMNLRAADALSVQLQRPVADWSQAAGHTPLTTLVAAIALAWQAALQTCGTAGFAALAERFRAVDALYGKAVTVSEAGRLLHAGRARGTDELGRLLLEEAASGATVAVSVGDVSVRPQGDAAP